LIEEGLRLRKGDIHCDILVFRGFDQTGAFALYEHRLTGVVSQWNQFDYLSKVAKKFQTRIPFHLKFDTGMNRLGFSVREAGQIDKYLKSHPELEIKSVLTHFHSAEDANVSEGHSAGQLTQLLSLRNYFDPLNVPYHALNSSGMAHAFLIKQEKMNGTSHILHQINWGLRPGLSLYGYCDVEFRENSPWTPVMTLKSRIAVLRKLMPGETVSYGATWTAKRETDLAVVPLGYADGYQRASSNRGKALFMGVEVPLVGNICMDYLMLDVTDVLKQRGISSTSDQIYEEEVIFFGPELSAKQCAQAAKTITWEILTSVSERVPRVFTGQMSRFVSPELSQ
jgi:alanine racemase